MPQRLQRGVGREMREGRREWRRGGEGCRDAGIGARLERGGGGAEQ